MIHLSMPLNPQIDSRPLHSPWCFCRGGCRDAADFEERDCSNPSSIAEGGFTVGGGMNRRCGEFALSLDCEWNRGCGSSIPALPQWRLRSKRPPRSIWRMVHAWCSS